MRETERLREQLKKLRLHSMAEIFEQEAEKAAKGQLSYTAFLARLADEEVAAQTDRSINARVAKARFPFLRTLEGFDFSFQPGLNASLVRELAELGFLEKAQNVVFAGPPGVGKTHLAVALGFQACAARKRVLFCHVPDLLEELAVATVDRSLASRLQVLSRLDLLICDELGYMPMDRPRANLFFQLVSRRYEKGAIVITTNKPFEQWGEVFGDDVIASAILDRLLHHCHVLPINGPSYRIKDQLQQLPKEVA